MDDMDDMDDSDDMDDMDRCISERLEPTRMVDKKLSYHSLTHSLSD